jgi:hypothetical protein
MRLLILAVSLLLPGLVAAEPHSAGECREGGDFIRNAALSRDGGTSREFFVNRLEQDFVMIRAFPKALRWFAHDSDDEQFLRTEVASVFDSPLAGDRQRAEFLTHCIERSERLTSATPGG